MMARSLEGMIIGNSVRAVISLSDLYLPLFYFMRRWAKWNGEENMTALRGAERRDMESLRSVKRSMEQETKKGSCPLMFIADSFFQAVCGENRKQQRVHGF